MEGASLGSAPIVGGPTRSAPTATFTAPGGAITTTSVSTSWSYTSPTSRPQHRFRVRLMTPAGDELYDSGVLFVADVAGVTTSDGTFEVPYVLSTGTYRIDLEVADSIDWSSVVSRSFSVDVTGVTATPIVEEVGSVFDIAIAGIGLVLADRLPDRQVRRTVASLQAPRFSTGETPFSQAIDRYSFSTQQDWSGGAGQRTASRPDSAEIRFFQSQGVDPFTEPGALSLLPDTTSEDASVGEGPRFVSTADDQLVVVSGDGSATVYDAGFSSPSSSSLTPGSTTDEVRGLCSDGLRAYAQLEDVVEVYDGSSWSSFGSTFGTVITDLAWAADRVAVGYTNGSDEGVLSTLSSSGAEEVAGGRFKFPDGTVQGIAAGDGFLWFGVNKGRDGVIYAWQLGSSDERFVALRLPTDQVVDRLFFYLGNLMIAARDASGLVSIYRAVPQSGELTPSLIAEIDGQTSRIDFTSRGALVFFTWTSMNGSDPGIGAIDLSTSGWASWIAADAAGEQASSVVNWSGTLVFSTLDGSDGTVWAESTDRVDEGWLEGSTDDLSSGLRKVFDDWLVRVEPLADADDEVSLEVSLNGGTSFFDVGTLDGQGATSAQFPIELSGASVTPKLTLRSSTGDGPVVRLSQVRLHALTVSDQVVEFPLDLGPNRVGLNGRPLFEDCEPIKLMRTLQSLIGTRVQLQDVDWPRTREVTTWEVTAVETTSAGSFDRAQGKRTEHDAVAAVTLRRPL